MNRYLKISLVALLIFALPYLYLAHSLAGDSTNGWLLTAVPFLVVLGLPVTMLAGERSKVIWWRDLLGYLAHFSMGVTTYLLVFALLRDGIRLCGLEIGSPSVTNEVIFAATALAVVVGGLIAATGPRSKRVRVPIKGLPKALDGFRIAQISDLHAGPTIRVSYVRRAVRRANAFRPDMVALTGDIADAHVARTLPAVAPLGELAPKGRVFYVTGNHEYYWGATAWIEAFGELGITALLNRGEMFSKDNAEVFVAGLVDPASAEFGGPAPDLAAAARGGDPAALKILLSHRPGFAHAAGEAGFRLQLSGHTHGGQFFPWTLVVAMVHEFYSGLHRAGPLSIYVSVGTGSWGPLLRLGTWPEVTCLTLEAEA